MSLSKCLCFLQIKGKLGQVEMNNKAPYSPWPTWSTETYKHSDKPPEGQRYLVIWSVCVHRLEKKTGYKGFGNQQCSLYPQPLKPLLCLLYRRVGWFRRRKNFWPHLQRWCHTSHFPAASDWWKVPCSHRGTVWHRIAVVGTAPRSTMQW